MLQRTETKFSSKWGVCLTAVLCCFLWGSAFPCIKIGYRLFSIDSGDPASQILFAGVRFILAGILVFLMGSILQKKVLIPKIENWLMVLKLCMMQTVLQYLLFYIGIAKTTGVKSSIIQGSNVFFALLISSLLLKSEKLGKMKILGCLVGFAGVILINLNGTGWDGSMSFLGEGFVLLSNVSYACSASFMKFYSQKENPVTLSGYQFMAGGLIMVTAGALMGGELHGFTIGSIALLGYLAFISAVAYTLWGILLKYNPVGKVAVFGFMTPLFGVLLSALILGEQNQLFTAKGVFSLLLVCVGIYLVNRENV